MHTIGDRTRAQPAPPHIVAAMLVSPNLGSHRAWLALLPDEVEPHIVEDASPDRVIWSSLWPQHPDVSVRFDLTADHGGTRLRWRDFADGAQDDSSFVGHVRRRMNQLINSDLRYALGQ